MRNWMAAHKRFCTRAVRRPRTMRVSCICMISEAERCMHTIPKQTSARSCLKANTMRHFSAQTTQAYISGTICAITAILTPKRRRSLSCIRAPSAIISITMTARSIMSPMAVRITTMIAATRWTWRQASRKRSSRCRQRCTTHSVIPSASRRSTTAMEIMTQTASRRTKKVGRWRLTNLSTVCLL